MVLRLFKRSLGVVSNLYSSIFEYLSALLSRPLVGGDIVLDIGASIGVFAIAMALQFPLIRVYAVEPSPQNFRYLLWNIRENNVSGRVWPLNVALRGPCEEATLALRYSPVWPTASAYCPPQATCGFVGYSAPALTLAELLRRLGLRRVRWLKLDCEGCEWRAGADPAFLALVRATTELASVEFHPCEAPRGGAGVAGLLHALCPEREVREGLLGALRLEDVVAGAYAAAVCHANWSRLEEASALHCDGAPGSRPGCTGGVDGDSSGPSRSAPRAGTLDGGLASQSSCPDCGITAVPGGTHSAALGRRIFLLSSFSHDDAEQWSLIPHFVEHYRDYLGLQPRRFLFILHSDSRNATGLGCMAKWLGDTYGVEHTVPVMEPYTALRHMVIKHEMLHRHVSPEDWVMQVDADEFLVFPRGGQAHEVLGKLDAEGANVQFGLMVDRLAADGSIDVAPDSRSSLFAQYPLNCAITLMLQRADIRKASAYRGYLRVTTGNHNVLGLNETARWLVARSPRATTRLRQAICHEFGEHVCQLLPDSYWKERSLPRVRPAAEYATVYHLKWLRGLAGKLRRRAWTEVVTSGFYADVREILEEGNRFSSEDVGALCKTTDLPGPLELGRGFSAHEFMMLFQNAKPHHLAAALEYAKVKPWRREFYTSHLLHLTIDGQIARENHLPIY